MTKKYIATKIITAFPETKSANEDHGDIEGYAVVYEDGYRSWIPKATFEAAYHATEGDGQALTFGDAIHLLKQGKKLARAGWNGKGMYLFLIGVPGSGDWWTYTNGKNDNLPLLPFIAMKTAGDEVVPWLASQTDMLADDWTVIE